MAALTKEEIRRYSRQLLVAEFGVSGQRKLLDARVLLIGAGGLGCPVAIYLAGAGVGTIGLVDFDEVSQDNLHRQICHNECNIGIPKVDSLKESILRLNSTINVHTFNTVLDSQSAMEIVKNFDIVADCSDNAATRYLINDVCVFLCKPLVSGSALRWEGQLTVYNYGETCPCYRCLFPTPPKASLVTNCSDGGVLGPVVGLIGTMQALEVIKVASGIGQTYASRLLLLDGLTGQIKTIKLRQRSADCAVCGTNPTITKPIDYDVFCGAGVLDKTPSLNVLQQHERIDVVDYNNLRKNAPPVLLDTRPNHEFAIASLPEARNITLNEMKRLPLNTLRESIGAHNASEVFVICHRGNDSQLAVQILKERFLDDTTSAFKFRDLIGGYDRWADLVDTNFPKY